MHAEFSNVFTPSKENKWYLFILFLKLKVLLFVIKDDKNNRNHFIPSCWNTGWKNATNMHMNKFGSP